MAVLRLKQVIKDLNISLHRAVEFLHDKGIDVPENPNAKIEPEVFEILAAEFQSDLKQKEASAEVVISKIPERKPEPKKPEPIPEKREEVIRAKAVLKGPKTLGKMDLNPTPKQEEKKVEKEEVVVQKEQKVEEKQETPTQAETTKESTKQEASSTVELPEKKETPTPKETSTETPEKKESVVKEKAEEKEAKIEEDSNEIKTKYQKLEGPKLTGETMDVSQFQKKPKKIEKKPEPKDNNAAKRKRKRIHKDSGPFQRKFDGKKGNNPRKPKEDVAELSDEEINKQVKETLEKLTSKTKSSKGAKHRREKRIIRREEEAEQLEKDLQDKNLKVNEFITVNELASLMDVNPTDIISTCFSLGMMVTMNQRLDADILSLVAEEYGYKLEFVSTDADESVEEEITDKPEDLETRAPIVTVMGHVDHGKTSLLDYIRKANVIAGESGGITQHIGAYAVELDGGQKITFLDTPGHEAFTAMRARGAQVTDLAIIVIAADDDIMPQTKEAISHAQAAGVPMIFAFNKVDKETANPDKLREQLANMNILVESWGGKFQEEEISAKFGNNIDKLLEKVLLEAEILELKANPNRIAQGVVIEASLEKGRGYVSTILVQNGTLKVGDYVLAGKNHGKVKAMLDERGKNIDEAGPSTPVTILGLDGAPTAGDKFKVYLDEKEAKKIATKREQLIREQSLRTHKHITLDELGRRIALGDFQELNIILKGDVDGSVEALSDSLLKLSNEEIQVKILLKGVGPITESDVLLASASDAVVIGFNVRPGVAAKEIAQKEEIEIRTYSIIYDAINDVKEAMEGLLSPEIKEEVIGTVEIRETYKISKVGTIAGCMVQSGKITRNSKIRVIREGVVVHDGELESLKRFKDDVKEVTKGYECGLNIKNYNDIEIGDELEVYEEVSVKKKL